jgi:RimJ/RimL family protein N-acetyltransferase
LSNSTEFVCEQVQFPFAADERSHLEKTTIEETIMNGSLSSGILVGIGHDVAMSISIPQLETERLLLREFRQDDFDAMATFYADPISQFYGGPCDRADAWRKFAAYPGHWALRGYGPWAIEIKSTHTFVGLTGMWFPEGWIEPEITWALVPGQHGKGYATEAARRSLQAAYDDFGWTTAISVIAKANAASIAVAERLGATLESEIDYRYGPAFLYRHADPTVRSAAELQPDR